MSELSLAFFHSPAVPPVRRSWARQSTVWALVALVHLFLITLFVMSEFAPEDQTRKPTVIETMFLLSMLPKAEAPPIQIIKPEIPTAVAPIITIAPVVVVPPPEPTMIKPQTPEDMLRAIGEALACGANSYEELSPEDRARCLHQPWLPRMAPDGSIVMEAPARPAPTTELHLSGADQLRHDMQTGPNCPILINTPCLRDLGKPHD